MREKWTPHEAAQARQDRAWASGYSRFVKSAKIVLPVFAVILAVLVIFRLADDPVPAMQQTQDHAAEKTTAGQVELVAAQYEGVDEKGQPYTLIARRATRDKDDPDTVILEEPRADMTLQDDAWIALIAETGVYNTKEKTLVLNDQVSIFHDTGYEMHLQSLSVNLVNRAAQSPHPVRAHGPVGKLTAQSMDVFNGGARVLFSGPATMTFFNIKDQG